MKSIETRRKKCAAGIVFVCFVVALLLFCDGCASKSHGTTGSGRVTTIALWHPWGGVHSERLADVVKEFNRTHPNVRVIPLFTPTDIASNQKFFTSVAANKAPDVVFVDGTQTAAWAEQGAIQPLDGYIKRAGIKPGDFYTPCWNQNYYKGHTWALTYCADPNYVFAWNKKVFRDVGLDPDRPPTTLAELDRYNDIITKIENGKISRIGILPASFGANALFTWGWAFKGSFYDPKTQKITANDPNVVKALEWMLSYYKKYDLRKITTFTAGLGSREQNPFYTGQIAMGFLHISEIEEIKKYSINLDYGLGYLPVPPGGEKHSSWVGGYCLALPKGSKHPRAAWEFIRWCCRDPKGTSAVCRLQTVLPGYKYSPYLKKIEHKPGYAKYLQVLRECKHQRPVMPAMGFYFGALDRAIGFAAYGIMTPKEALDKATKETQAELDLKLAGR
ncbi:MAG: ABC transporter substrate-binding protein [Armatimonadota bacterium]